MICERISATDLKSSPKQGLAATSTGTSSANSRASTARWILPPERCGSATGPRRTNVEAADQIDRPIADGPIAEKPAAPSERSAIEMAEGEVFGGRHVADAGVLQRHFRQDVKIVLTNFRRVSRDRPGH